VVIPMSELASEFISTAPNSVSIEQQPARLPAWIEAN